MKNKPLTLLFSLLLLVVIQARAQNAYPIDLLGLLGKISIPEKSSACYAGSTKTTDPSNGSVSIVSVDTTFHAVNDMLAKITGAALDATTAQLSSQPPSAEQIQQMKQQAIQRATAAQNMSPQQMAAMQQPPSGGMPSSTDLTVIKQMGPAQMAAGHINQLVMEMAQKLAVLDKSPINNVSPGPNCPEVQQGGYAGPTCDCMKAKDKVYEEKRVVAQDAYLSQVKAILNDYLGKIKAETAVVDNFEHIAKFGDAVSNPTYKQMVGSVQRQALGGVTGVLSVCLGNWEDAAKMYANLVNANSGASVGCYGR
jgi:hypothetical protein